MKQSRGLAEQVEVFTRPALHYIQWVQNSICYTQLKACSAFQQGLNHLYTEVDIKSMECFPSRYSHVKVPLAPSR